MRFIESDENLALRGSALEEAIKNDIKLGLIPFWVNDIYIISRKITFHIQFVSIFRKI